LPDAPISGTEAGDGEERKKEEECAAANGGGMQINGSKKKQNSEDLHDKLLALKKDGHLFNLVAKGFGRTDI